MTEKTTWRSLGGERYIGSLERGFGICRKLLLTSHNPEDVAFDLSRASGLYMSSKTTSRKLFCESSLRQGVQVARIDGTGQFAVPSRSGLPRQ